MTDRITREDEALALRIAGSSQQHVGSFRYLLADDSWEWSDAVAQMHGYESGPMRPTTELILQHKHPEDKEHMAEVLEAVRTAGEPFSSRHRIIDTAGNVKRVAVIGDRLLDEDGKVLGTSGFYLDLSDVFEEDVRESVDEAVNALAETRAVIEQAKGALMVVYSISSQHAFEILAWRSQETNVKLRVLAEQLVAEISTGAGIPTTDRIAFDHILMTLHERVPGN
ncbi:PAS and ANTAR domain-containing protein [Rhodococcus chondri]|uniref:PAS and ANTAR domain-containing protein n=1 Tax=Rhodococcus chondri TaxID=3065941 RepID=A0ABU7JU93_9NOCA|nr:PAS and ANTAR domain-containing protein [Rhodococcus sp. CC-R104]MEE2033074.1 PAS and ANTAR domain-containing protein [Rhodococcus sp. CC-R104]